MEGKLITFESSEGSGKSTQIVLLADALRKVGKKVVVTREPGGCPISDQIRAILLNADNKGLHARTELLLYAAARAQHVEEVIKPALAAGKVVLCDRYTDSSLAYQGYGRGIEVGFIEHLNDIATQGVYPNLTLILDLPVEQGLERSLKRHAGSKAESRFEMEELSFHKRVREGYLQMMLQDGSAAKAARWRLIPAEGSIEEVAVRIWDAVSIFLEVRG